MKRSISRFSLKFNNIDLQKLVITFVVVLVLVLVFYGVFIYTDNSIFVRGNNLLTSDQIYDLLEPEVTKKPMIYVHTPDLEKKLKEELVFLKNVKVHKSLFSGYIVQIEEFSPITNVKLINGDFYMLTKDDEFIKLKERLENYPVINYLGGDINDVGVLDNAKKTFKLLNQINDIIIEGEYNFDNFGNLSILITGNRLIRFDLNEKYFTIEDQVKLVRSKIESKINYNEIDIRFSYLLIK